MRRQSYQMDLTDQQWSVLVPYLPLRSSRGRPPTVSFRETLNAIFYVLRTGCHWRLLPHDFPKWKTVYHYFRLWRLRGLWQMLNNVLRGTLRIAVGREPEPSAAAIDSQSVKTTEVGGEHGFDAAKKINGRKRHILVDVLGLILTVLILPGDIQDRDGGKLLLKKSYGHLVRLKLIWADGGYAGQLVEWTKDRLNWLIVIVSRPPGTKGFSVIPRRWVVERTFGPSFTRNLSAGHTTMRIRRSGLHTHWPTGAQRRGERVVTFKFRDELRSMACILHGRI